MNLYIYINYFLQRTELSSKTPWIEILYHYLQIWRKSNEGRIPKTYKEKTELKDLIKAGEFFQLVFNLLVY